MKKLVLSFVLISTFYFSQAPQINLWRVTPDTICSGDTLRINYKANWPSSPNTSTNTFYIQPGTIAAWSGNWSILKAQPKEHWAALAVGDSAYMIKVKTPPLAPGTYSFTTWLSASMNINNVFVVKNCCSMQSNFTFSVTNNIVSFSATAIGTTVPTSYMWDFGEFNGFQAAPAIVSYTYPTTPSTYSVSMTSANGPCNSTTTKTLLTVATPTIDGIEEYRLNGEVPVYFDLMGNRIEPRSNELIIQQVGRARRKIIIQQ